MKYLAALLLTVLAGAIVAVPAQAHDRAIPTNILTAVKILANEEFDYASCRMVNYRRHIRCNIETDGNEAVLMIHRVSSSRYQMVATMFGVVFFKDSFTL